MRILLATSNQSVVGGVETYLHRLIPALGKRWHEVAILYQHPAGAEAELVDPPGGQIPIWYWPDLQADPAGWAEIAAWKPDLVYSHCPGSLDMERVLLENYPCVLHVHNYWGTCTTGRKCQDFPRPRACNREFGVACLALHYPRRCGGLNPLTALRMFQEHKQRKSRLPRYQRILVSSAHMYREYERNSIDPDILRVLPYPLTDASLEIAPYLPKRAGGSLLFAGRLTDLKGADYLIRAVPIAARQLGRELKLTIVGDGPERERLQSLAQQLGVAAQFTGWLAGDQKLAVMRASDLLVVPSRWPEPFGLVGIEAGALSIPAVAYALGGIPDWLVPGLNGELAPGDPPTIAGLADAISAALNDADYYARLRRGAWEYSRQFRMDQHLDQLETILEDALGETARPAGDTSLELIKLARVTR